MRTRLLTLTALLIVFGALPAAHAADAPASHSSVDETVALPGEFSTDPKEMSCTVAPADANDDSATTTEGTAVDVNVASNDYGLGVAYVGEPNHGTAQLIQGSTIRYTPDPGFTGTDSFIYTVSGCLQCHNGWCSEPDYDTATVTVTVNE